MVIVNKSHQNFDNSIKTASENSHSILPLTIKTISLISSFTNITKILISEYQKAFISKYFSNKLTKLLLVATF